MSAAKIDVETAIYNILSIFQTNLNNKLDSINTEKNDGISCQHVDPSIGYAILTLEEKIMNVDPLIFIFIEDILTVSRGPASESNVSLVIVVVKEDDGSDTQIQKKMLRYMRACSEVIEDNFSDLLSGGLLELRNLGPRFLQGLNTSKPFRGAGVAITMPVSS
jgi:hypothetical protein